MTYLADEAATEAYGAVLAHKVHLQRHTVFYFQGEIGAGKTTLIRSLLRHLGVTGPIKSPTFSIMEPYMCQISSTDFPIYHFDLYRLGDPQELEYIGWRECFSGQGYAGSLCCVEWPERAQGVLPEPDNWFTLSTVPEGRQLMCKQVSVNTNPSNALDKTSTGKCHPVQICANMVKINGHKSNIRNHNLL